MRAVMDGTAKRDLAAALRSQQRVGKACKANCRRTKHMVCLAVSWRTFGLDLGMTQLQVGAGAAAPELLPVTIPVSCLQEHSKVSSRSLCREHCLVASIFCKQHGVPAR